MSVTGAMIAVGTIAFWIAVLSFLAWRFKSARPVLEGLPLIIVRDGQPLERVLRIERITLDELKESARSHGISDLDDIKLGVLEPDGHFSFITHDERSTPDATRLALAHPIAWSAVCFMSPRDDLPCLLWP
ncbi:MAG: DUF421 domain-containing protein [Egibacteraceae bacterium]